MLLVTVLINKLNLKSSFPRYQAVVEATAYDDTEASEKRMTRAIENNPNPQWNQELDFGSRVSWQYMDVSVLGYDPVTKNPNAILMDSRSFSVNSGQHNKQLCTSRYDCSTKLTFSFTLMKPNCLCYNGRTCTMEGGCNFPAGYGGPQCEHVRGRLRIYLQKGEKIY